MARRDRRTPVSKQQSQALNARSFDAIRAQAAYDAAMDGTLVGARSHALRDRAVLADARGDRVGAHALYLQAASLLAHDDDGPAAAACRYDLGESYMRQTTGVREENLLQARALFERALGSPARQGAPLRLALTLDALGRALRALADVTQAGTQPLLDAAEQHLRRACVICEGLGPVGLVDAAGYRHNLGNLLLQRERWNDAETSFRRALAHASSARNDPYQLGFEVRKPTRPFEPMLHLGLARMLVRRDRSGDLAPALRALELVIRDGDAAMVAEAHLLAGIGLLHHSPERTDEAHAHLRAVDLWDLEPDSRREWLGTLRDCGQTEIARRALRLALADAMQRRKASIADHAADHGAREAQQISLLAAELHADEERPIEAFLALEETAALRYFESVHAWGWQPRDPVSRYLAQRRDSTAVGARILDEIASRLGYLTDAGMRDALDESTSEFEHVLARDGVQTGAGSTLDAERAAEAERLHRTLIEALRKARPAPSPPAALREAARELGDESLRANEVLADRDPEADHQTREGAAALNADGLRRLLEEHPGDVLLRVSLERDLLAVAVWIEQGSLTGRSFRRVVGPDEWRALSALYRSAATSGDAPVGESVSDALAVLLPRLDLTDALPDRQVDHLVILPSMLAALIPWASAGAAGRTLLDRADAISYLPNLAPRVTRQHTTVARAGTVLVAPGECCHERSTRFHGVAFSTLRAGETALFGADATRDRMVDAASRADVVSVYTHGLHVAQRGAELALADGDFSLDDLDRSWFGCERVELWACQSGVNLPTDWLTPMVDEAFGIDVAFHHGGVRSTIGSLWSVPALVTAHLVRRYREGLAEGRDPRRALADAQRWWRDEVIADLPELLARTPEHRVSDAIAQRLGTALSRDDLDATLGEMRDNAPLTPEKQAGLFLQLSTPEAWAGFRFTGVVDRRPVVATGGSERPLSPDERAEVDALLATEREPGRDVDAVHRERLAEATALGHQEFPTSEQAVMVARRYSERGLGSMRHNLLRGLAWVHEALAAPGLTVTDLGALALEAAWLWTELARGELDAEQLRLLYPSDRIVVERSRTMLGACAGAPETPILQAWVDLLSSQGSPPAEEVTRRWPSLRGAVGACAGRWPTLRATALVVEWLLACADVPEAIVREAMELARSVLAPGGNADTYFVAQRLRSGLSTLALRVDEVITPPAPHLLSAREIVRSASWFGRLDQAQPDLGVDGRAVTSTALDRLEGIHWGAIDDDLTGFWDSSGTPGVAWQRVASSYFTSKFHNQPEPRLALHHLASMQLGADLRLGALRRQVHLLTSPEIVDRPCAPAWHREHLLQRLEDLARLPDLERGGDRTKPARPDGFRASPTALIEAGARSAWMLTGWGVATTAFEGCEDPPAARTCAFLIERHLVATDAAMRENWQRMRKSAGEMASRSPDAPDGALTTLLQTFAPPRRISDLEAWLGEIPSDRVVLGVSIGPLGELVMSVVCRVDAGTFVQPLLSPEGLGWQVLEALRVLLAPSPADHTPMVGTDATRTEALERLRAQLDEPLGRALVHVPADRARMLSVFAPGALRAVPWGALTAGGIALRDRFAAVTHLPCLGFGGDPPEGDGSRVFCALGDEREEGETRFGECAVTTLRGQLPGTLAAETGGRTQGANVSATELLDRLADRVEVVRWYGVGAPWTLNPSTEGLRLTSGHVIAGRNLLGTALPRCRRVEYWAATGDLSALVSTTTRDREAYPELVWSALAAGADGVLDLAWPVHDLVKALVCERFGITARRREVPDAVALGIALREIGALLARWEREAPRFDSTRAALAWLDEARRIFAVEAGLDAKVVIGFASHADAPTVATDVSALVRICSAPSQLGAFRWWGT